MVAGYNHYGQRLLSRFPDSFNGPGTMADVLPVGTNLNYLGYRCLVVSVSNYRVHLSAYPFGLNVWMTLEQALTLPKF